MRFVVFILAQLACILAHGAENTVQMAAVRVSAADIYFTIEFDTDTEALTEIRVSDVKPGSSAERAGLRRGDCLVAIDGVPVVGRKRSSLIGEDRSIEVSGRITFTGHRGLFRKDWKLTVEVNSLARKKTPQKALEPTSIAPSAAQEPRQP